MNTNELAVFIVKDHNLGSIVPSLDFPGAQISKAWAIGRNRVRPGDRVAFTRSWKEKSHTQGTVIDKIFINNRYWIIFIPDSVVVDVPNIGIKNKFSEKNYIPST